MRKSEDRSVLLGSYIPPSAQCLFYYTTSLYIVQNNKISQKAIDMALKWPGYHLLYMRYFTDPSVRTFGEQPAWSFPGIRHSDLLYSDLPPLLHLPACFPERLDRPPGHRPRWQWVP